LPPLFLSSFYFRLYPLLASFSSFLSSLFSLSFLS
jgi:hypothetical protein